MGSVRAAGWWSLLALAVLPVAADPLPAQAVVPPLPPVLHISREAVIQGRVEAHALLENRWANLYRRAGVPIHWVGATTMTGASEAWFFSGLGSMAEFEERERLYEATEGLSEQEGALLQADAANISGSRGMITRLREDLSQPGGDVATSRYIEVIIFRIRPGHEAKFEELAKLYRTMVGEAKIGTHWATYQVQSGMPAPTFLVLVTRTSLGELDPGPDMQAMQRVMTPARQATMNRLSSEGVLSTENILLRLAPRMSYLPKEMTDRDPAFWNRGPVPATP